MNLIAVMMKWLKQKVLLCYRNILPVMEGQNWIYSNKAGNLEILWMCINSFGDLINRSKNYQKYFSVEFYTIPLLPFLPKCVVCVCACSCVCFDFLYRNSSMKKLRAFQWDSTMIWIHLNKYSLWNDDMTASHLIPIKNIKRWLYSLSTDTNICR